MISIAKVKSYVIEKGYRILKVENYGARTADECSPFGEDSNPLKDMTAIFAETGVSGEPVIIGYMNSNQLAALGEKRIYSLKENGDLAAFIWLKNDGSIQINGDTSNLMRYQQFEQKIIEMQQAYNSELSKIQLCFQSLGITYTPAQIQTDFSSSKVEDIKTI